MEKVLFEDEDKKIVLIYKKPSIIAQGKEGPKRPCRPNHKPSGKPCNPPAPGVR